MGNSSTNSARIRAVKDRLRSGDQDFDSIDLMATSCTDEQFAEVLDCLREHPNCVTRLWLSDNKLTDVAGVKLAQWLVTDAVVCTLDLSRNLIGERTYKSIATALRTNTTLRILLLHSARYIPSNVVKQRLIGALRVNPCRAEWSLWYLHNDLYNDFEALNAIAAQTGPVSMLEYLAEK